MIELVFIVLKIGRICQEARAGHNSQSSPTLLKRNDEDCENPVSISHVEAKRPVSFPLTNRLR